jgi:lysophospholipase L1-like esterase
MRWALGVLLVTVLAASGCDHGSKPEQFRTYVALGDSYTSGTGLRDAIASTGLCGQSPHSYPFLVAHELTAELADASCGGASTDNGTIPEQRTDGTWPPQLDPLERGTDLVTVSLGVNDFGWFGSVMFGCTSVATSDPTGDPCSRSNPPGTGLTLVPDQISGKVETLLAEVQRRAPDARVLLVGYPQPVPAKGTCPELPLATGDYPFVRAQWEALDAAMRKAAAAAKVTYVSVVGPSEGHDICAGKDAWVNGVANLTGVAAAYHPLELGQAGVARLVEQALRE